MPATRRRTPSAARSSRTGKRRNGSAGNADAARELSLSTINDGDLYRQQAQPIIVNLARKMAKGTYSTPLAVKLWGYLAENGARKYAWLYGTHKPGTHSWSQQGIDGNGIFNKTTRTLAAEELEAHYLEEVQEQAAAVGAKRAAPRKRKNPVKKKQTRLEELQEWAESAGYIVEPYSPGDGVTRYRFFLVSDLKRRGYDPATQSYFGPANGTYTALGLKQAWAFLTGARSGRG